MLRKSRSFHGGAGLRSGVQPPLSSLRVPGLVGGGGDISAPRSEESFKLRGKGQSSRRERTHWKEMPPNSCCNLIPSAATEKNLLRVARDKCRIGAAVLMQIYTAPLTLLVDSPTDETTHPDLTLPLAVWGCSGGVQNRGMNDAEKRRRGMLPSFQYLISQALCVLRAILLW